jgi:thiamine-monophosphate kinase
LSDGLSLDLARLCEASGVGADLDTIPVTKGASLDDALNRGEDYELLFTSRRRLPYIAVGKIVEGRSIKLNGRILKPQGYDHFARNRS